MALTTAVQAALGAATDFSPHPYPGTPVPGPFELHMMNRMGCGYTPGTLYRLRRCGGALPWFERQLNRSQIAEAPKVADLNSWFPGRSESMPTRWRRMTSGQKNVFAYGAELGSWSMLRRILSHRTVHENMVDFWSNHFHVPVFADKAWVGRHLYDTTIRAHALGRFDELLAAVSLQPSMLLYLDNYKSVRNRANENQGRELLELHTVGSGYTEDMVRDSAVILSGWTVREGGSWETFYDPRKHTMGRVRVLGFSAVNDSPDGREVTRRYLRYLAHHPLTARTIARKLAIRFVRDNPSDRLVDHLATVFLRSGTDIKATLRALVRTTEFAESRNAKVRTPYDDLVATARVLRVVPHRPVGPGSFATAVANAHGADVMFNWPRPDGAPQANAAWCSASRMLASFQMHLSMSGHFYPNRAVTYRPHAAWLPQPQIRFDRLVDHLSRALTGRPSTSLVLRTACEATGTGPATVITRSHPLVAHRMPRLLTALLDSPAHMTR